MKSVVNICKIITISVGTITLILIAILTILFTFNGKTAVSLSRKAFAPFVLFILGVKIKVKGKENVPLDKPLIIVSNHQSFLDIPIIFNVFQRNLYFVAKHELKKIPFLGWYMTATGMIFVKRGKSKEAVKSMIKAARLIKKGKNVVLFPEGTRSKSGEINSFKKGAFHLAVDSGVDVLPIAIKGATDLLPANILNIKSGNVEVRIGEPLNSSQYVKKDVLKLTRIAQEKVKELYLE